jgi:hypothetical protein
MYSSIPLDGGLVNNKFFKSLRVSIFLSSCKMNRCQRVCCQFVRFFSIFRVVSNKPRKPERPYEVYVVVPVVDIEAAPSSSLLYEAGDGAK